MSSAPPVSILIVSYNTRQLTLACLEALFAQTNAPGAPPPEVILVDNDSADGSAEAVAQQFPAVRVIRAGSNLGFAAGNNLAARHATADWLLLLNPDTAVLDGAVGRALAFAEAQAGEVIVGGRTFFADGRENPMYCHNRPTPWSLLCTATGLSRLFRRQRLFNPEAPGFWSAPPAQADAISGCFLLVRRRLWEELGGLDESFFMYGEETDFCLRAREKGARCLICHDARLIHHGGAAERVRAEKIIRLLNAKLRLIQRYWNRPWRDMGRHLILLWPFTRMMAYRVARLCRHPRATQLEPWLEVWRRRPELVGSAS